MKRFLAFLLLSFLLAVPARASLDFNSRLSDAYDHILRLEFDAGKKLLDEEKKAHPSNHLVLLYENYVDFLTAFLSEEEADFATFKKNSAPRCNELEEEGASPWKSYALAECKLQDAFLKMKFREFISAAFGIRAAYRLLDKNTQSWPAFPLNRKALGLVHTAVGSVPPEYRWATELAGMKGSVSQGVEELRAALDAATGLYAPYAEEILFYLSTLQCSLGFPPAELNATAARVKPYADVSPLLSYCYINLCIRSGNSARAMDRIDKIFPNTYPFHFLDYKKGMLLLGKLDMGAEAYFHRYLAQYKGMNFIKATYQKLAWIHLLQGDTASYFRYMKNADERGTAFVDDDKQAVTEARSGEVPHVRLLRARLLYDGGYYDEALAEFRNTSIRDFPRLRDQVEVTYRLGRIYMAQGQPDKAIPLFRQTLHNGETARWHYAANAALLLGNAFEESKQKDSATYYYNRCLELRHHEYQNSIDQKAQAGLERVRGK